MGTTTVLTAAESAKLAVQDLDLSHREDILEQLGRLIASPHFRNSKRYPALLRYIVEEVLEGRADSIKERTLGLAVFDRPPDYDTNADPVVRITAGEVRKRIAQYYQSPGRQHELRIEIPLGSYLPRFYRPLGEPALPDVREDDAREDDPPPQHSQLALDDDQQAAAIAELERIINPPAPSTATPRRRLHLTLLYTLLFASLAALAVISWRAAQRPAPPPAAALFWGPLLRSSSPTLIVLGVHSFDDHGNDISAQSHAALPQTQQTLLAAMTRSDMVHLSDLTSYGAMTKLLTRYSHSFRTQGAADTTLEQLREGPFLLIGGFNNTWTKRLTEQLRFRFVTLPGGINVIQDSDHPATYWTVNTAVSALDTTRDYALISSLTDPRTGQSFLLAGGIGKSGTEAATDFLTNEQALTTWLDRTPHPAASNIQVVIATEVIEGKHGPPTVIAYHFW